MPTIVRLIRPFFFNLRSRGAEKWLYALCEATGQESARCKAIADLPDSTCGKLVLLLS
jgi:hypothetical protein